MQVRCWLSSLVSDLHPCGGSHSSALPVPFTHAGSHAAELLATQLPKTHRVILIDKNRCAPLSSCTDCAASHRPSCSSLL
jgi:hypothetical protein